MAQKRKNYSTIFIIGVSLLIGFLGGYITGFKYGIKSSSESQPLEVPPLFESSLSGVKLNPEAIEIVRELNCICGKCQMELLTCTCEELNGSRELKIFVQKLVDDGLSKSEAIAHLVERYGQGILIKKRS